LSQELFYSIFHTSAGWIGIINSENGLKRVTLPQPTEEDARRELGRDVLQAKPSAGQLKSVIDLFRAYYSGKPVDFYEKLDFSGATPFQRSVWEATRQIPYGETRSYRWVAEMTGRAKAARAVGQALGKNPLLVVVPCHRVVESNGGMGGFGGGIEVKKQLLEMEVNSADKR
jgi:methylated-DNA-[protein]-cysteine S-methyltransferase